MELLAGKHHVRVSDCSSRICVSDKEVTNMQGPVQAPHKWLVGGPFLGRWVGDGEPDTTRTFS